MLAQRQGEKFGISFTAINLDCFILYPQILINILKYLDCIYTI